MNGSLLDTNVIIKYLNGDPCVGAVFKTLGAKHVSIVTVGELMYGAMKSTRKTENLKMFEDFLANYPVLETDLDTARVYGGVKAQLVKIGENIPDNDIWIAAAAMKYNLELATQDKHFLKVKGLKYCKSLF